MAMPKARAVEVPFKAPPPGPPYPKAPPTGFTVDQDGFLVGPSASIQEDTPPEPQAPSTSQGFGTQAPQAAGLQGPQAPQAADLQGLPGLPAVPPQALPAVMYPSRLIRPNQEAFPETFLKQNVNIAARLSFSQKLPALHQAEVIKAIMKDLGLENAVFMCVPRGIAFTESGPVLFLSIPRRARRLPNECPDVNLQTRAEVEEYFETYVVETKTPFERRVYVDDASTENVYRTSSGVRDVYIDLNKLTIMHKTAMALIGALASVGFPAPFSVSVHEARVREGEVPRDGVQAPSSRGPYFGETIFIEVNPYMDQDSSYFEPNSLEVGNRLVSIMPASRVLFDRLGFSLGTVGLPLELSRVHHRMFLFAAHIKGNNGLVREIQNLLEMAYQERLISWIKGNVGEPPARRLAPGADIEESLRTVWGHPVADLGPSDEPTLRQATANLLKDMGDLLHGEDLEKYLRIPLNSTDTHAWFHVWGSIYPLVSNFEVNVPLAFGAVVSRHFTEETVKDIVHDILASREVSGNRMETWNFIDLIMRYVKAALRSRPVLGAGVNFVQDHFNTLLLLAPYIQNPSRCIIKTLAGLPSSGVELMREKGVVPWNDVHADVLHRAFGRKTHGVLPFDFKAHIDADKVKTGLKTAHWALHQSTLLAIAFKHFFARVPDTYHFGNNLGPMGPHQEPEMESEDILGENVQEDDDGGSPVRITSVTHLWVNVSE